MPAGTFLRLPLRVPTEGLTSPAIWVLITLERYQSEGFASLPIVPLMVCPVMPGTRRCPQMESHHTAGFSPAGKPSAEVLGKQTSDLSSRAMAAINSEIARIAAFAFGNRLQAGCLNFICQIEVDSHSL